MIKDKYDFKAVETNRYQYWQQSGFFACDEKSIKPPFSLVIPPPNITSNLHIGHAWDNTLQDIIIRRKRMQGYDTLYLPGTDHAGIATQAKIDAKLKAAGTDRFMIGRTAFLKEAFAWQEQYQSTIYNQWAALGLSVDYNKLRFTLDDGLSESVYYVFKKLYDAGLIYRGYRIINWDPVAKTALSNIEVVYEEQSSKLYYLNYPLVSGKGFLTVATTRPETMFADQALMVNPHDKRYFSYIGHEVYIPNTTVKIPVISDEYVDKKFGTGVVKVTPAHDPNDFEVAKRHQLKMPLCMNEDATINALGGKYAGLDRFACRKQLISDLTKLGLVSKIEDHQNSIGFSERTKAMVEPRLSLQWFVKMKTLATDALKTKVNFVPKRFMNNYRRWLEQMQDWCISRQLWWGHRIPAYYNEKGEVVIAKNSPGANYKQDEDVLDTWFSSALWPFSTLGWPQNTTLFKRYYPTNVLVTGYDILFFWVSRMIFQGRYFTKLDPFKDCLLHGLIRANDGQKMSKSLGNGVDPLIVIKQYGTDALRLFLATNASPGLDLRYDETKVKASASLINKLYNIGRYLLLKYPHIQAVPLTYQIKTPFDAYIINKLNVIIKQADKYYDKYLFSEASKVIINFLWDDLAQSYLEISKFYSDGLSQNTASILKFVLLGVLKLLHPFIPFVTDYLYEAITGHKDLMISPWPQAGRISTNALSVFSLLSNLIATIRKIKADNKLLNKTPLTLKIITTDPKITKLLMSQKELLMAFVALKDLTISAINKTNDDELTITNGALVLVFNKNELTSEDQVAVLTKKLASLTAELERSQKLLANPNFLNKADAKKVALEQAKAKQYQEEFTLVQKALADVKRTN